MGRFIVDMRERRQTEVSKRVQTKLGHGGEKAGERKGAKKGPWEPREQETKMTGLLCRSQRSWRKGSSGTGEVQGRSQGSITGVVMLRETSSQHSILL